MKKISKFTSEMTSTFCHLFWFTFNTALLFLNIKRRHSTIINKFIDLMILWINNHEIIFFWKILCTNIIYMIKVTHFMLCVHKLHALRGKWLFEGAYLLYFFLILKLLIEFLIAYLFPELIYIWYVMYLNDNIWYQNVIKHLICNLWQMM